jgi:hypothetical protein
MYRQRVESLLKSPPLDKVKIMTKQAYVTSGTVAFSNITEFDVYKGKPTGSYSLTITLEPSEVQKLEDLGVKVRTYENAEKGISAKQRKFRSQYHVPVVDLDGHPVSGEIPYGSKVRVAWVAGDTSPEYGTSTYLNKVRLVEVNQDAETALPDGF